MIRLDPTKIVYWTGYKFGKFIPQKPNSKSLVEESLDPANPSKVAGIAGLVESVNEELDMDEIPKDEDWFAELKNA